MSKPNPPSTVQPWKAPFKNAADATGKHGSSALSASLGGFFALLAVRLPFFFACGGWGHVIWWSTEMLSRAMVCAFTRDTKTWVPKPRLRGGDHGIFCRSIRWPLLLPDMGRCAAGLLRVWGSGFEGSHRSSPRVFRLCV